MCEKLNNLDLQLDLDYLLNYIEGNCQCSYCINNNMRFQAIKKIVKFLKYRIIIKRRKYGKRRKSCHNCISDISRNIIQGMPK